jgi:hypothetical protein
MFRLYLEYARLISPDRDNGKMVCSLRVIQGSADKQDFVLEDRHVGSEEAGGPAPGVHVEEGAILDVTDR